MAGTYVLVLELDRSATIEVGALGAIEFDAGRYAYVGSAFGSGGFSRIDRHRDLAAGDREVYHWHVDYLLCHSATEMVAVGRFPGEDIECELARTLPGTVVPNFGASDCECDGHLLAAHGTRLRAAVAERARVFEAS